MVSTNHPLTPDLLRTQLGSAYEQFLAAVQQKHLEMLRSLAAPRDVVIDIVPAAANAWTVTICAADRLGMLSIIAGLFTTYHIDIQSAYIFTVAVPRASQPRRAPTYSTEQRRPTGAVATRRQTLDIFNVRTEDSTNIGMWERFRTELAELAEKDPENARSKVIDGVSAALGSIAHSGTNLYPMSIEITNEEQASYTRLDIRSQDLEGFLFAFTNALAGSTFNIDRAFIETVGTEAHDTFWITDRMGKPVTSEQRIYELRMVTALVKEFTYLLPRSPNPGQALRQFRELVLQMLEKPEWAGQLANLESSEVLQTLANLMGVSRFLWEDFLRLQHENLYPVLVDVPSLAGAASKEQLQRALADRIASCATTDERVAELNAFKDREMFRIDLRHITNRIPFPTFSAELTDLAEVVVEQAGSIAHQSLWENGHAMPADWRWSICGLGKFGGRELGFGSDIELLFVHQGPDNSDNTNASLYFEEFVRVFQSCIQVRQNGIFEIDLRLRPYGRSGSLAVTLDKFRTYYSPDGPAQQFERLALVKLRPVAGDPALGDAVVEAHDAFVYSGEQLDIENIRHLRQRQAAELVPRGEVNAKYSAGGLVDVEYYVQAQQIIAGHAEAVVRATNTLDAVYLLAACGHMSIEQAEMLRECYGFLRQLIDALRVVRGNAKDLNIPAADSSEFAYLAHQLRFDSTTALQAMIADRMGVARGLWD